MENRPELQMLPIHQGFASSRAEAKGARRHNAVYPAALQLRALPRRVHLSHISFCSIVKFHSAKSASHVLTAHCATRDRRQSAVIKHGNLQSTYC